MMKKMLKWCFVSLFMLGLLGQVNAGRAIYSTPQGEMFLNCANTTNPFCQPISLGNLEAVKELLKQGADVNSLIEDETPLYLAVVQGDYDIAKFLIEQGAKVNVTFNEKEIERFSPLFAAVSKGDREMAELLISKGAKINSTINIKTKGATIHNMTPLHSAIALRNYYTAELLIKKGANVNAKDEVNGISNFTPLHQAAFNGDINMAKLLIEKSANVNAKFSNSVTPLHTAAAVGNSDMVALLIEKGAKVNAMNESGGTPLDNARNSKVEEVLKKHGAQNGLNVAIKGNKEKQIKENLKAIDLKVLNGEITEKKAEQFYSEALLTAIQEGKIKIVKAILDRNVINVNSHMKYPDLALDTTPLIAAVRAKNIKMIKFLISEGADVNEYSKFSFNYNPLSLAVVNDNMKIAKLLVSKGANANSGNGFGMTPLYYAKTKEMAQFLVSNGADVNAKDIDGNTPLHKSNYEISEFLIEQGADINAKNRFDDTPLDNRKTAGSFLRDKEITTLLLRHGAKSGKNLE